MNLNMFKDDWRGTKAENIFHRVMLPLLVISNIASATALVVQKRETVLVPPMLSEKVMVSQKQADVAYKKSFSVMVSMLLGNVTPSNADYINEQLSQFMDAIAYHGMRGELADQIAEIKSNNLTIAFEQKQVEYEPDTDKVFVIGKSTVSGTAGRLAKEDRVFEMRVEMIGGRPLVTAITSYRGEAMTAPAIEKIERRRAATEEREQRHRGK